MRNVTPLRGVLVTDFDGTITRNDFYQIVTETLLPPGGLAPFHDYKAGTITHFEALQRIFAALRVTEVEILAAVAKAEPEPELASWIEKLASIGWKVIVTSAGCQWYIDRILSESNVDLAVHANPGRFDTHHGLLMEMPHGSRFVSEQYGIDKAAVVREMMAQGLQVAYAGDGMSDVAASLAVPDAMRFARDDLARVLTRRGVSFRPFERWGEIAAAVYEMGS